MLQTKHSGNIGLMLIPHVFECVVGQNGQRGFVEMRRSVTQLSMTFFQGYCISYILCYNHDNIVVKLHYKP